MKIINYSVLLITLVIVNLHSQNSNYYFYHPEYQYGSELYYNPLSMVINGSFDILRNGGHDKNIFNLEYEAGFDGVLTNILNPIENIEKYGWKRFISQQVFPISSNQEKAQVQYVPNYTHHIIGEGMLYVRTAEWYDYHKIPYPYFFSILTNTLYQFVNEAIENRGFMGTDVDPIADLLIFNPLGILLFSFDATKKFFSQTVQLSDWSLQPIINPATGKLENGGEQFAIKYGLPFAAKYSAFVYWGIYGLFGLSYSNDQVHNYSFGVGTVVNKLKENIINDSRWMSPELDGAIGFFYDKNHSLMTSIIVTGPRLYNIRINVYPGYFKVGYFSPGFYLGAGEWDKFLFGVTLAHLPVGLFAGDDGR